MNIVRVNLPNDNGYDIKIGTDLMADVTAFVANGKYSPQAFVVADTNTAPLYGEQIKDALVKGGLRPEICAVPAGETAKSLRYVEELYNRFADAKLDRKSLVVAVGGGVVGDLAGFVAATYMRSVPFVQVPTTLLAQVDSSVGGKTAINLPLGKNLVGAFYQPDAVFIDLNMLQTLPKREIATGLGEIVKYGVIADAKLFSFLEENYTALLNLELVPLTHVIGRSCAIKADVVGKDEKEAGLRRILNFGHTVAHAVEQETNYSRYNHGEAVALGSLCAARLSKLEGYIDEKTEERLFKLIDELNLPTVAAGCTLSHMEEEILRDKKTVGGKVNWVLMRDIGEVFVTADVTEDNVKAAMLSILP